MKRDLQWEQDEVFLEQSKLEALAKELPTPFYLYDEAGISRTAKEVMEALDWVGRPWLTLAYCPCDQVVTLLWNFGWGLICNSQLELERVAALGFQGEHILYAPLIPSRNALELLIKLDGTLGLDSGLVWEFVRETGLMPAHIQLRYNPLDNMVLGTRIVAKPSRSKVGMTKDAVLQVARDLKKIPISTVTIGGELGVFIADVRFYSQVLRSFWELKLEIEKVTSLRVTGCYLGDSMADEEGVTPEQIGAAICAMAKKLDIPVDFFIGYGLSRLLLSSNGILISRVLGVKHLQRGVVILDVTREAISGLMPTVNVHVSVVGNTTTVGRQFYTVVGCSNGLKDRFSPRKLLPPVTVGQYCALHGMGYHTAPLPQGYGAYLYTPED